MYFLTDQSVNGIHYICDDVHVTSCILISLSQDLLDVNSLELARQLTLTHSDLLREIRVSPGGTAAALQCHAYTMYTMYYVGGTSSSSCVECRVEPTTESSSHDCHMAITWQSHDSHMVITWLLHGGDGSVHAIVTWHMHVLNHAHYWPEVIIQWNLSIVVANGPQICGCNREVAA